MLKKKVLALELLLLGIAVGLLTAPRSGAASRELIVSRLSETLRPQR